MKRYMILIAMAAMITACQNTPVGTGTAPDNEPAVHEVERADLEAVGVDLPDPEPVCGNGVKEAGEECDGDTFVTRNYCEDYGFTTGQVRCDENCMIDVSGCTSCGDGVAEGGELCDLDDTHDQSGYPWTCQDLGFSGGSLMCNSSCNGYDTSACE